MNRAAQAIGRRRAAGTGAAVAAVLLAASACAPMPAAVGAASGPSPDAAASSGGASAPGPSASDPAAGAGGYPAAGVVVTDPAYVPTIASGSPDPAGEIGHPALQNLPAGWDPTDWTTRVSLVTGDTSPSVQNGYKDVDETWDEATSAPNIELGVTAGKTPDTQDITALQCFARGFQAADGTTAAQVTALLTLCGAADFPGGDPADAEVWIRKQTGLLLHDLAGMRPGEHVSCATPVFGAGLYVMTAQLDAPDVSTIVVDVYGAVS